jgi:hypothetical protein
MVHRLLNGRHTDGALADFLSGSRRTRSSRTDLSMLVARRLANRPNRRRRYASHLGTMHLSEGSDFSFAFWIFSEPTKSYTAAISFGEGALMSS